MKAEKLQIGVIFPEVLGTYGDGGNARVLFERARLRGYQPEIVNISLEQKIPLSLDIYTLGGGEDVAQRLAANRLVEDKEFQATIAGGVPLLAICAGLQILGNWFVDSHGKQTPGAEMLDCITTPMGVRAIGELVSTPLLEGVSEKFTGFENHGGYTELGADASPLGKVERGYGNGHPSEGKIPAVEGAVQGSIVATYMHGPALARNPQLADYILAKALGVKMQELETLDIPEIDQLRAERLAATN